eukprot:TRINITY_DN10987_c0_g1_i1.p1 TRINITY_DN10987_c0_g1~~TRINITY_DN10987_c0_g1_i1.p1  ORF type:complete len:376 (-),score=88.88 TRINITY_DN10987_c0_g1_i1:6-1106(-)
MSKTYPIKSPSDRTAPFWEVLNGPKLDLVLIQQQASAGLPDCPRLRTIFWKIFLGYLPLNQDDWDVCTNENRRIYRQWKKELMVDPNEEQFSGQNGETIDVTDFDHPLSTKHDSKWAIWFKDCEMLHEIDKDVRRTLPQLHFFNSASLDTSKTREGTTENYESIRRILFLYSKLNPGIAYVQGMNEIVAPIFYVFARDGGDREDNEADTFHCFKNLMSEIMNNFCMKLDTSEIGIKGSIARLNEYLKEKDYELWANLEEKGIHPQFFTFRWITLLLSQEFDLPDVLVLWDCFFSDSKRFHFHMVVCCAMIIDVRELLSLGEFADNIALLQKYPPVDVLLLVSKARKLEQGLWPEREDKDVSPTTSH